MKKDVLLVIILAFILSFLIALLLPYIPLYGEDIGLSISMIGYVVAVYHLVQVFGRIPMGSLSDILGYNRMIVFGSLSLFLSMILYLMSPVLWPLLFLAQILVGIAVCMEWVTLPSFMTQFGKEKIPLFTLIVGVAYTMSVPLGGFLKDLYGMDRLFLICFLLSLPTLFIVFLLVKNDRSEERVEDLNSTSLISIYKDSIKTLKNPEVMRGSLFSVLMFMNFNLAFSIFPLYLSGIGFTATIIGLIQFTRMGFASMVRIFSKKIEKVFSKKIILTISTGFSALAIILVSQTESLMILILISMFWGIIGGLYHPVVFEMIADGTAKEDRGKGMGIRGTMGTIGSFSGIIIFSNLAEIFSVGTALLIAGISMIIGVILIELYLRPGKK